MPVEALNGLRLHTQTLGGRGPHVVLLHGMLIGSLATWYFSIGPALARTRRVHMYDLRGHGLSEAPAAGYGIRSMADDLEHVIRRFAGDEPVALVGHSFGAVIALRHALDHPRQVQSLVLIEAPLPVVTGDWVDAVKAQTRESVVAMLPPPLQMAFSAGGRRAARMYGRAETLAQRTSLAADLGAEPDIDDAELATLRPRALLCYGTQTVPSMLATRDRLARVLPNATLRMIEGNHFLPAEAPQALARTIGEFLDA